ncbi:MAG: N-acetylmuramic acid 6-phosphate etherase [Acidimicrobiia bacterium]|nr:N-acetylmuramic acid 6-phosphate etherase [Acidimicrobiia bacterium]
MKKPTFLQDELPTEERNPASMEIDLGSTEKMLRIINREDQRVAQAVAVEIPQIAKAVELVSQAFQKGGRLFYVGAGTSGRLGILDASECVPTFNAPWHWVQGVMAGGMKAAVKPVEASEDSERAGALALKRKKLRAADVVAGIAASGRTPYTLGAMKYARSVGAAVLSITCNPNSKMAALADVSIAPLTGPEVVTGSTRMKAGTAQKLVLNMLTTASMIKLGYVYSNLMIHVQMKNEKLRQRGRRIVMSATGADYATSDRTLRQAQGDVKTAIVMLQCNVGLKEARKKLKRAQLNLRAALAE